MPGFSNGGFEALNLQRRIFFWVIRNEVPLLV